MYISLYNICQIHGVSLNKKHIRIYGEVQETQKICKEHEAYNATYKTLGMVIQIW